MQSDFVYALLLTTGAGLATTFGRLVPIKIL